MTLVIAVKGPEGAAICADSRLTASVTIADGRRDLTYTETGTKLFAIDTQRHVGVLTYGMYFIGGGSVSGFFREFEAGLPARAGSERLAVADVASKLTEFFQAKWQAAQMPESSETVSFIVTGFDVGDEFARIYDVSIPGAGAPVEQLPGGQFGVRWAGESQLVARLINGVDPDAAAIAKEELTLRKNQVSRLEARWQDSFGLRIPYDRLPLQDCVDLAVYLVTMTSVGQSFTYGRDRGVGGPIDVAAITGRDGFRVVRQKQVEVRERFDLSRQRSLP